MRSKFDIRRSSYVVPYICVRMTSQVQNVRFVFGKCVLLILKSVRFENLGRHTYGKTNDERRTSNFEHPFTPQTTPIHTPNFHTHTHTPFQTICNFQISKAGNNISTKCYQFSGTVTASERSEMLPKRSEMLLNGPET